MSRNLKIDDLATELQTAANAARAEGNELAALELEQSIAELKKDLPKFRPLVAGVTFGTSTPRNIETDMAKWSLLKPKAIHATALASVIDCGQEGRITIIGGSILIKGSVAMQPMTALLIADHAQRNHNGGGTAFGCQEFLHNIAVANVAMGTAIGGVKVVEGGKAAIDQIARGWESMVTAIRAAAPAHPVKRMGRADVSIANTPEPVA